MLRESLGCPRGGKESALISSIAYDAKADASAVLVAGGSYTLANVTVANMAGTAYLVVAGDISGSGPTPLVVRNAIFYNDNPAMTGTLLWLGPSVTLRDLGHDLFFNPYRTEDVICAEFPPQRGRCFGADEINRGLSPAKDSRYTDPLFADPRGKVVADASGGAWEGLGRPGSGRGRSG